MSKEGNLLLLYGFYFSKWKEQLLDNIKKGKIQNGNQAQSKKTDCTGNMRGKYEKYILYLPMPEEELIQSNRVA